MKGSALVNSAHASPVFQPGPGRTGCTHFPGNRIHAQGGTMRWKEWVLGLSTLLVASPLFATTYFGGFEDTSGPLSDYDYNDLVFSISGTGLKLHTGTGYW